MTDIRFQIVEWLNANAGTHAATDAATNAVLRILEVHPPTPEEVCIEDGQDYEPFGCRTTAAIAGSIREQDPTFLQARE